MAKSNTARKSSVSTQALEATEGLVVPMIRKTKGNSELLSLIDKAILGAGNIVQSMKEVEPLIAKAAVGCVTHCEAHGDTGPADRLVKGLIAHAHPTTNALARELVTWFKLNSPIQWEGFGKGKVFINKNEDKGRVDYDTAQAEEVPFNETAQAKRARTAAEATHKNSLADADFKMMLNRAKGTIAWLNKMVKGEDERKVKPGELPKMTRFASKLNDVFKEFGGEDAVVEVAKPKRQQKEAA